jgi:hypothetical protein
MAIGIYTLPSIIKYGNFFLNFSYLNWTLIFSFIGFVGIFLIDLSIQRKLLNQKIIVKYLFTFLLLLPSLHFWSSGISKEALSIFSIGLLIYGLTFNYLSLQIISIFVMFFIRIHIFLILSLTLIVNYFLKKKISPKFKLFIISIAAIIFFIAFSKLITNNFIDLSVFDKFFEYSVRQRGYLKEFTTWYDTNDFGSLKLIFYHLFYPLNKFDSYKNITLVFENFISLLLFLFTNLLTLS